MSNDRIYYSHSAEMLAMRAKATLAVFCFFLGTGVGAVLTLILAPATVKTSRLELAKNVESHLRSGREAVSPMVKKAEKEIADLQKKIGERFR